MIVATKGIVFNYVKYGENSIVCKIYTEELGIKSYIINITKGKKNKNKMAFFQPLTLLEMLVYEKENRGLQRIKEYQCDEAFKTIPYNIYKSCMVLFIAELLYKTIREEESNAALFNFLRHFVKQLDAAENNFSDYHLIFITHLTQYLGFFPKTDAAVQNSCFFDMLEGKFVTAKPLHKFFIEEPLNTSFVKLLNSDYNAHSDMGFNGKLRQGLIEKLLQYYKIHMEGMGTIHSVDVLKKIFSNN